MTEAGIGQYCEHPLIFRHGRPTLRTSRVIQKSKVASHPTVAIIIRARPNGRNLFWNFFRLLFSRVVHEASLSFSSGMIS